MDAFERAEEMVQLVSGFQYLYSGGGSREVIPRLLKMGWGLCAEGVEEVEAAWLAGMSPMDIYCAGREKRPGQIESSFGKCRFVSGSLEEMQEIDRISALRQLPGHLEVIGICVIPDEYYDGKQTGFKASALGALAREFRKLQNISIRGCFIEGDISSFRGKELGRHYRRCYETAKCVTTSLPCGMSFVNAGHCTEPLWQSREEQKESFQDVCRAAEIMRYQNETAFYARLLVM